MTTSLPTFLLSFLLMGVIGLYIWVYQKSLCISSDAERIWGPAWLTALLLGVLCSWFGIRDFLSSGKESAELFSLGTVCFLVSGLFFLFWRSGMDEDTD